MLGRVLAGDRGQVPRRQHTQLPVGPSHGGGRAGFAAARPAGEHEVLPRTRVTAAPAACRTCSARTTATIAASRSLTPSRAGRLARSASAPDALYSAPVITPEHAADLSGSHPALIRTLLPSAGRWLIIAFMPKGMVAAPPCAVCGTPAARLELVAPGMLPVGWEQWRDYQKDSFRRYRGPAQWWLLYEGVAAGNGGGNSITAEEADRLATAFGLPYSYDRVHLAELADDAGFCAACGVPYCYRHWQVSHGGYGTCPERHGKSLDPHWSPEDYDDP